MDIRLLTPTHLFHQAVGSPLNGEEVEEFHCSLCGLISNKKVDHQYSESFTNFEIFKFKNSMSDLCPACSFSISSIKDLHKTYLLTASEMTFLQFEDMGNKVKQKPFGKQKIVKRDEIKNILLDPPKEPWVLMLVSGMTKKHGLLQARVNYGNSDILWVSEAHNQHAIPKEGLKELIAALETIKLNNDLYSFTFSDTKPHFKHKNKKLWEELTPIIEPHKNKHYFSFLYDRIVPKKEFLKGDK